MERPRIMQIVSGVAIGDQSGGAESFGIRLAHHLSAHGFDSAVFAMWRYESPAEREWLSKLDSEGIPVFGLVKPNPVLIRGLASALAELWQAVSTFRPHIIGSHSERGDFFNVLLHVLHPLHPRAVRTMHTDEQWQERPRAGALLSHFVFPLAFCQEVAISEAVRTVLDRRPLARVARKRSFLCHNGIDAGLFDSVAAAPPSRHQPPGLPDYRPLIGSIGRLSAQKGHGVLLQALRIIQARRLVHVAVIGSGPLENELREMASRMGLGKYVHFLGSRRDIVDIIPHLDAVVSSSLWEGFPTVLLEAMALGVPVVATDVSGSRELIHPGETGLLVPPGHPDALAKAILETIDDKDAASVRASAGRVLASKYTIQRAATAYASIYRELLGETSIRP